MVLLRAPFHSDIVFGRQSADMDDSVISWVKPPLHLDQVVDHGFVVPRLQFKRQPGMHNESLRARSLFASQNKLPSVEVPLSAPQIKFEPEYNHWTARGQVLRCHISDEDNMPVIQIDDQELTWEEFGRLVVVYAGWGMRVVFVSDDEIHREPRIVVKEPEENWQMGFLSLSLILGSAIFLFLFVCFILVSTHAGVADKEPHIEKNHR